MDDLQKQYLASQQRIDALGLEMTAELANKHRITELINAQTNNRNRTKLPAVGQESNRRAASSRLEHLSESAQIDGIYNLREVLHIGNGLPVVREGESPDEWRRRCVQMGA